MIVCEGGLDAVGDEIAGAVDGLDVAIEGLVAFNEACEVAGFVEDGGKKVITTIGGGVWGCYG